MTELEQTLVEAACSGWQQQCAEQLSAAADAQNASHAIYESILKDNATLRASVLHLTEQVQRLNTTLAQSNNG